MQLRPHQQRGYNEITAAWESGFRDVLYVAPTGFGKTVVFSHALAAEPGASCAIAHRQELVGQMALALTANDVPHNIIAPAKVVKEIVHLELEEYGRTQYDPNARCTVAGVDTLNARADSYRDWGQSVRLNITDEGHHLLPENKWGKARRLFSHARGLGVTATPLRADGRGLDESYETMIEGPPIRQLIDEGSLLDYRYVLAESDIDLADVPITRGTGDFSNKKLIAATRKSHIVGDVVDEYIKRAYGRLGVTFVPDVQTAADVAAEYNRRGVPAAVLTAKTPLRQRVETLRRFRKRELLQLVNVDLFGEGFDLPALEVVSMARATCSLGLFIQQCGRCLRVPLSGDMTPALIIDHVGNWLRHNFPDAARVWSLGGRGRANVDAGLIPLTGCIECCRPYVRTLKACPWCGHYAQPSRRDAPEFVTGDLVELDPATLARMRDDIAKANENPLRVFDRVHDTVGRIAAQSAYSHQVKRLAALGSLRGLISTYGRRRHLAGDSQSEMERRFYLEFGVDVGTAQTLKRNDASVLACRVLGGLVG